MGLEVLDWIYLFRMGTSSVSCGHRTNLSVSLKARNFLTS